MSWSRRTRTHTPIKLCVRCLAEGEIFFRRSRCFVRIASGMAEGFMTIAIARTVEQDIFDKARVALDLLPSDLAPWAIKLLNARQYEIIKIGYEDDGLSAKFGIDERECDERKELLLGPDDIYIKPLEELTGCFVIVNWNTDTVIARGLFEGLKLVRMIVEECIVCKIPAVDIISKIRTRGAGALLW
ncbi:KRR1 small subunit processome component-like isoform X3 [Malus sylvestris]|uniref:KRR1 small subunit processome component-like isoform X3 n=1 Tax=Malus sylvestris TaxID=3752 RepID=UPI0021ACE5A2|nr:KRR1 small subunit processome component-like isoform X3 [Malus sylvestris]